MRPQEIQPQPRVSESPYLSLTLPEQIKALELELPICNAIISANFLDQPLNLQGLIEQFRKVPQKEVIDATRNLQTQGKISFDGPNNTFRVKF